MKNQLTESSGNLMSHSAAAIAAILIALLACPISLFSQMTSPRAPLGGHRLPVTRPGTPIDTTLYETMPDSIPMPAPLPSETVVIEDRVQVLPDGEDTVTPVDTVAALSPERLKEMRDSIATLEEFGHEREFNPDPTRAVWMSALFPGVGQLYNRRYWKLPIVVGAFMGLGYATSWNNRMLTDYTRAYRDIMDNDPSTNSYMDFYPPTTKEEDLNKTWLTNTLRSRRDYFRRNRDLCIIAMVGVYLLAIVDAYVDASLAHFDISPNLSVDVAPAVIPDARNQLPSIGVQWAVNF